MRLKFPKLDRKGIPLAEVLAVHHQFQSGEALPDNLGDGYLFHFNPLYRNLRQEFLGLGFSFTQQDFCHYYSFPLMSLDEAIAAERIPYRNNVVWLEKLEAKVPGKFTLTELKRSELQFNYLFHESAHFVAHRSIFGKVPPWGVPKTKVGLMGILLGEAFANSVECLSAVFVEGEIGSYFLDGNSHFRANSTEVKSLRRAAKRFGFEVVMRQLMGAFLYSNYLYESLSARQKEFLVQFSGMPAGVEARAVAKIGLGLNETFRTTTTQLHLIKQGFSADLEKLMSFDPLEFLLKPAQAKLLAVSLELAHVATRGLPREGPRKAVGAFPPRNPRGKGRSSRGKCP